MKFTYLDTTKKIVYEMDLVNVKTQLQLEGYKGKKLKELIKSLKNGNLFKHSKYAIYRII